MLLRWCLSAGRLTQFEEEYNMTFFTFTVLRQDFVAEDFCRVKLSTALPAHSSFADCRFILRRELSSDTRHKLAGPGIYAICYKQELIYLGKYLGQSKNPFAGNVARLRWIQHLGSMTMRDRRVSLSKSSLDFLLSREFSNSNHELIQSLASAFETDRSPSAIKPFLQRDRGCFSTVNRVLFALKNWPEFSNPEGPDLSQFSFHYFRIVQPNSEPNVESLRTLISSIEDCLVEAFRPTCNATIAQVTAIDNENIHILDELGDKLRDLLSAKVASAPNLRSLSAHGTVPVVESDELMTEPEETSAESKFLEKVESGPSEAMDFIYEIQSYASEKNDVELHYTRTNGGDLRLRKHGSGTGGRQSQNFLTLDWQTRDQAFKIVSIPRGHQVDVQGELSRSIRPVRSGPLACAIKIGARSAMRNRTEIFKWLEKGYTLI